MDIMSDYIDTREGWTEIPTNTALPDGGLIEFGEHGQVLRQWVRDPPRPPLPVEPYTVIRVEWRDDRRVGARVLMHLGAGWWMDNVLHERVRLEEAILAWWPLAEPRAVTAKALIDRIDIEVEIDGLQWQQILAIGREFGVDDNHPDL